jgi:hypothetical protein
MVQRDIGESLPQGEAKFGTFLDLIPSTKPRMPDRQWCSVCGHHEVFLVGLNRWFFFTP